jgi:hypothetical protein
VSVTVGVGVGVAVGVIEAVGVADAVRRARAVCVLSFGSGVGGTLSPKMTTGLRTVGDGGAVGPAGGGAGATAAAGGAGVGGRVIVAARTG